MEESGLIYAFLFDGKGGGRRIDWGDVRKWRTENGVLWLHFDYSAADTKSWLLNESGLDEISVSALTSEETRPRAISIDDDLLVSLRGINLNPGASTEDMVAIRIRASSNRIITTRKRKLISIIDIAESLKTGKGPTTAGEFIVNLSSYLIARMEGTIEGLEDRIAEVEEEVLCTESFTLRSNLSVIRREAIMLRRFLAPQREAMHRLSGETISWLSEKNKAGLREVTDRLIRYVEDLNSIRDRASVTQEELSNRFSEQINSRMYVLSLVAAIFLPLGFLTGLLGINVGGIPGAENSSAFLIFVLLLLLIIMLQLIIFKKKKWL